MLFTELLALPITWIIDFVREPRVEETAEQLQWTSLDGQDIEPSPGMPQNLHTDHTNAPGDGWKVVESRGSGRREGPPRPSRTAAHGFRGERRSSRGDQSQSHSRTQATRIKTLENDYRQLADKHKSLENSHRQLHEAHQTAITDLHETQMACKKQQQEINALGEKLRDTSALLDVRNREVKIAKTFLSKEDLYSASDVVQSVRDLNSEIMQTAAYLAENLSLKRFRTPSAREVPEGPYKSIFVTLILPQGSGEEVDTGSLELAIQGFLGFYASMFANLWGFAHAPGWCDNLYSKVCEMEDRTVASNWRVLTRRTLNYMDSSYEDLPGKLADIMIERLAEVLSSCGLGTVIGNANDIKKHAAEKLGALSATARKLNKMIGENVVSEDLVVTFVHGGTMFNGESMDNAYPQAGVKPAQRVVICTTDLGLCKRKSAEGARKELLKPKVVLHDS